MLQVTVHEDGTFYRLQLAGGSPPMGARNRTCLAIRIACSRKIELDMRPSTDVDDAGRELLLLIHMAGVRLIVEGVWMKSSVEETTEDRSIDDMGISRNKSASRDQRSGSRRSN